MAPVNISHGKTKRFVVLKLMLLSICFTCPAQELKDKIDQARTIYVAPLQHYNFYAIKTRVLETDEVFTGRDYTYNGTYRIGERVKNIIDVYDIVGQFPEAYLQAVNDSLIMRCRKYFGADKVKVWPEAIKNASGDYDQQAIAGDYYIILSRRSPISPVKLKTFKVGGQNNTYKMMGDMENIEIALYKKVAAGKKGEEVFCLSKGVFFEVDPVVYQFAGKNIEYKAASEFISTKANKALADKVNELLDEFFAKCEAR